MLESLVIFFTVILKTISGACVLERTRQGWMPGTWARLRPECAVDNQVSRHTADACSPGL